MASSEFKQAIKQPSREIKSRITFPGLVLDDYQVSEIDLDSALIGSDDFEIGTAPMDMVKVELIEDIGDEWGRNLILNSGGKYLKTPHLAYQPEIVTVDGKNAIVFNSKKNMINWDCSYLTLVDGEEYTFSFLAKGDRNMSLGRIYLNSQNSGFLRNTIVTTEWQKYSFTFTAVGNDAVNIHMYPSKINDDGTMDGFYLTELKLEKGSIATPWTPAPEDYANYDYKDKECDIELGLTLPDESVEYLPMGKYTVENAVRKNNVITLDCVDRMYKAEKEYVSDLMYPTTILEILQSACDQAGIELATTSFANSDYIVPNEPVFEGITCRKVFAQVAELAGGYAKINRLGQLEILTLGASPIREVTKEHYNEFQKNEVADAKIDKVIVKVGEERAEAGEGENIYTVVDNMFVQNPSDVVDDLYDVLKNVSYTACTLKWQGDFSLDLGDKVTIDGYETYILERKLSYKGGLKEDYSAPAKSNVEKESTGKGSLTLDIENVKTRIKVIDGEITQTIESIDGKVENEVVKQLQNAEIYTWIKYADDEYGNGISDNPTGKKYVGIAVNKKNVEPSNNPADYEWSRIQGYDGQTTYTWIKYADDKFGNGMSDVPDDKRYVGIATNKTTPNKSTNPNDYEWSPLYDNVEIGGENRLYDSRTNIEFYANHDLDIRLVRGPGKPYYKAFNPSGSNINLFAAFPNSRFAEPLESLGRVTVSLEVMVDVDRDVTINGATFPVKGNRWTKVYFSKTFDKNITENIRVRNTFSRKRTRDINVGTKLIDSLSININTLYYRNLQVEKGNVPTDHNLTPEELEGSINRTSTELKQLSDSISLIARRNENTGRFEVTPEAIVAAIDTTDGVGKVKNVGVTVDERGLEIENGALIIRDAYNTAIVTSDGLKVMYIFTSSGDLDGWQKIGVWDVYGYEENHSAKITIDMPDNLLLENARLYARSMPSYKTGFGHIPNGYYHPRNLKIYKGDAGDDGVLDFPANSEYGIIFGGRGRTDITSKVWGGNWSPTGDVIATKACDITEYLTVGELNHIIIESADSPTSANARYSGAMLLEVVLTGFLRG